MSKTTEKPPNGAILAYLQRIPTYPYDPKIDPDFVEELLTDFGAAVDVLEETKAFRWYHTDQATSSLRSARLSQAVAQQREETPSTLKPDHRGNHLIKPFLFAPLSTLEKGGVTGSVKAATRAEGKP